MSNEDRWLDLLSQRWEDEDSADDQEREDRERSLSIRDDEYLDRLRFGDE
mgnify:CR=1 FL=1